MTVEEAFALVARACADYRGTLQEHQAIQAALRAVREALPAEEPSDEE